ncbi:MAG: (2Fe-2S)-binding protein [Thermodesulfobacteriota bacterium]
MSGEHQHQGCGCGCGGGSAGEPARDWSAAGPETLVCPCLGLDKAAVREAIAAGAYTVALVKAMTGAGRGRDCAHKHPQGRSCLADLEALVRLYADPPPGASGGCG